MFNKNYKRSAFWGKRVPALSAGNYECGAGKRIAQGVCAELLRYNRLVLSLVFILLGLAAFVGSLVLFFKVCVGSVLEQDFAAAVALFKAGLNDYFLGFLEDMRDLPFYGAIKALGFYVSTSIVLDLGFRVNVALEDYVSPNAFLNFLVVCLGFSELFLLGLVFFVFFC